MIATALAVAFVVYSCKGKLAEAESINIEETPMQVVDDMFIVHTKNGKIQMRAQSPLMEKYQKDSLSYELFPQGFFVYSYNEEEYDYIVDTDNDRLYLVTLLCENHLLKTRLFEFNIPSINSNSVVSI